MIILVNEETKASRVLSSNEEAIILHEVEKAVRDTALPRSGDYAYTWREAKNLQIVLKQYLTSYGTN